MDAGGQRFWPFPARYAWWASAVLVPVSVAVAVVLQATGRLPGRWLPWWLLLGAVLVGLLPVLLLILGRVSSVKAAGVEVTFAAVQRAVRAADAATVRSTLSDNLGAPPGVVLDSSGDTIIQALRGALTNDVVVVNLGDGHEWWDTRLLLLVAGAARLGHPAAIAFTAVDADRPDRYVGWATPAALLRTQLSRRYRWRAAYRQAERTALRYTLADFDGDSTVGRLPWPAPAPVQVYPPGNSSGPDDPYLPERFLLDQLRPMESSGPEGQERLELTSGRVKEMFEPVLHRDSVDTEDDQQRWLDVVLAGTAPFVAVTTAGRFVSLVPRAAAVNGVLRGLLRDRADGDAGGAVGPQPSAPPT